MITFLKKHKKLYATLMPILLGLLLFVICLPVIYRPITFAEADALTNIFHSQAWGLRSIAVVIMCVILVVAFHVIKLIRGLKWATILGALTVAAFALGVYIKNIPTAQEAALPNIIADVQQFDAEPQTIYFDIPEFNAALFYSTPAYPVAELSARPTGNHHFWLVVPFENLGKSLTETTAALRIPAGYYIANQLGNDYYAAVDLTLAEN